MSARRVIDWHIVERDDGTYDLFFHGRLVLGDTSMIEVNKRLRRQRQPGESVYEVNGSGQSTNITQRIDRRHKTPRTAPSTLQPPRKPIRMPLTRW